jgi:regulatory protein
MPRVPDDDSTEPFEQLAPPSRPAVENRSGNQRSSQGGRQPPAAGGRSLKARAVGYLSRREYSRIELQRKLQPYAEDPNELERVLDALEREQWLSNERFARALVHRKAARQGTARIVQELRRHGLPDGSVEALRSQLQDTELQRAREVWRKKFGGPPQDDKEYGRQYRFLASRGFSADCLRRILGERDDSPED